LTYTIFFFNGKNRKSRAVIKHLFKKIYPGKKSIPIW